MPVAHDPPEALRQALRSELVVRKVVWQPSSKPKLLPEPGETTRCFIYTDGRWRFAYADSDRDKEREGAVVVFGSKTEHCSVELVIIRSDRW